MYLNKTISVLALMAMIGTSAVSLAQDAATPSVPPAISSMSTETNAASTPAPAAPASGATTQSSVDAIAPATTTPVDASTVTSATPVVAPSASSQVPMDASSQVMLQSVMLVNLPKADGSIVDKLVEAFNSRDYEKYSSIFSKEGFTLITSDFQYASTPEALKNKWDAKVVDHNFKDSKAAATVESVKDLAPGIAMITGKFNLVMDANRTAMSMFTLLVKYEDNAWKINTLHASSKDVMRMVLADEIKPESNAMIDAVYAILGLLIGFVLAKLVHRKAA